MLSLVTGNSAKLTSLNQLAGKALNIFSALEEPQFSHLWQLTMPDIKAKDSNGRVVSPPKQPITCDIPLSQVEFVSKSNGIYGYAVVNALKFTEDLRVKFYNSLSNDTVKYFQYWRNKQINTTDGTVGLPINYYFPIKLTLYDKLYTPTLVIDMMGTLNEFKFDGNLIHDTTASKALFVECSFKLSKSKVAVKEDLLTSVLNSVSDKITGVAGKIAKSYANF